MLTPKWIDESVGLSNLDGPRHDKWNKFERNPGANAVNTPIFNLIRQFKKENKKSEYESIEKIVAIIVAIKLSKFIKVNKKSKYFWKIRIKTK